MDHRPSGHDRRRSRPSTTRRGWFARLAGFAATAPWLARFGGTAAQAADSPPLLVRSRRPLDLETPVTALGDWLTPADRLFVRSHFGSPSVEGDPWTIAIAGLVERPLTLSLEELARSPKVSAPAVIQCAGNGRAFFRPRIPGLAWERGAVGHCEWAGVRLSDVLARAGVKPGAAHVQFLGTDGPPNPKTPQYLRSLPLGKALDPSVLLATEMNGEPLPVLHGGPVRLVVPGWTANHWMKWVRWITVSEVEAPGFYQQTGYKIPTTPVPPEATPNPANLRPVTVMNVKSLITAPAAGAVLAPSKVEVRGVAWTGDGHVDRIEVGVGRDGAWKPAEFLDPPRAGSWRRWRITLGDLPMGELVLRSRATDSLGNVQPETTPWNRSGYLWNAIDEVAVKIG